MDCAADRHDGDPVPALAHSYLCRHCTARLGRDLRQIPALDSALEHLLTPARQHGSNRGTGDGLPYSDPVSECRSQTRHDLRWWTVMVAGTRQAAYPSMTVPAMCGFLHGQVQWCTFRDWAGDYATAIGDDRSRALALLDPWVRKRFPVRGRDGKCLECAGGRLWVTVYASDGDKRRSHAECDGCGVTWLPEQWLRLGTRIIQRREQAA